MALLCFFTSYGIDAQQCTLVCNDQVQVSLDQTGMAIVLPDMILDGEETACPGPKTVEVMIPSGSMMHDTVTCQFTGEVLNVRVTDNATGNFCQGTILVEDKLPPLITCQDTTVHCTADLLPDSLGYPLITDNCGFAADTVFYDNLTADSCTSPFTAVIVRTWQATDESNNVALPCVQVISIQRPSLADVQWPLNFDNVEQPALSCSNADTAAAHTGLPMIDSIPAGSLCKIVWHYDDLVIGACGEAFTVLRQWTVLDCCSGEIITHDQLIKVADDQPPVFDSPDTLFFNANGSGCAGTFLLPALPVYDDCSGIDTIRTVVPNGTIGGNGGPVFGLPMGQYTVVYEAIDGCGNMGRTEVVVVVEDRTAPVAVCDEITQVSLTSGGEAEVPAGVFDDGSHDNCCEVGFLVKRMDQPDAPFQPEVIFTCNDIGDSTRVIVEVTDCHGNANNCMVTVLTEDKMPPSITCPPDLTLACTEWQLDPPPPLGDPFVQENCSVDTLFFNDQENLNICHTGTVGRTYTVVDGAGFSAQCQQTITLVDTTASTFIFPPDTLTDCSRPIDSISAGEAMALADCEAWALNISDEIFPIECGMKIFRTYTFLEWCTLQDTSYTQFIEVRDTNPPVWDQPAGSKDTSYVCPGDLVKPGPPTATDFCTPATVTLVKDTIVYMGCENRFTRTFTYVAADTCGNVAEPFLINIFVNDTIPPSANVPDRVFSCLEDIPLYHPDSVDAADNCPSPVDIQLIGADTTDNGCSGRIVRTYRITDICGQSSDFSQNFIWNDTTPPVAGALTLGPFACLELVPDPDPATLLATDNCKDTVIVEHLADSTNVSTCAGLVWRTWRLTDQCNNDTTVTQILTVLDTVPPELNCPDTVRVTLLTETCSAQVDVLIGATDNCDGNPVTVTNSHDNGGATASGVFGLGTTPITFFASDACANVDSCLTLIRVAEVVPPSNSCQFIDAPMNEKGEFVLNTDSLLADGIIGGEDFCTGVTYSLNFDTLDCTEYLDFFVSSLGIAVLDYTLTVTDSFGNSSSCMNTIFLSDPFDICDDDGLVVGGLVFNEERQPLPEVETRLLDGTDMTYAMTSGEGWFHFSDLPAGADCSLRPYKNNDLRNGVTTYDLIKISKHILGEEPLGSPYKIIAADANRSGKVTTYDVVLIRKVILYVADSFPNNTSWRFVPAAYEFPDPANPFAEPFPEEVWINNIVRDVYGLHFIGIKTGDVNGSANPGLTNGPENRGWKELPLTTADQWLQQGQMAQIPIRIERAATLTALQATFSYDDDKMVFKGLTPAGLNIKDMDYARPKSGSVTLAWDTPAGRFLQSNDVIFKLQFQVIKPVLLSEAFTINSVLTPAIAYEDGSNPLNVNWRIHNPPHTMEVDVANFFQLKQNRPNPFAGKTTVLFYLKQRMPVQLQILDISGRSTTLLNEEMDAGWHDVRIDRRQLAGSGIYFYQLITPYGTERRKMVVQ